MDRPPLHGEDLLKSLVEISINVATARSIDGVLSVAGEGVKAHGMQMVVVQYVGDQGFLRYLNRAPVTEYGKGLLKPSPILLNPGIEAAFKLGAPLFVPDLARWLADIGSELSIIDIAIKAGFGRMVITPLVVNGVKWGALILASSTLDVTDVPALSLFSSQLYSAIEVAETIERLELRNKELEAVHSIATAAAPEASSARLLETIAQATHSDVASLHRYDAQTDEYVQVGESWGYSGPQFERWRRFKGHVPAAERKTLATSAAELPDPEVAKSGVQQLVRVALTVEAQPAGLLTLARRSNEPFTESQVRTAEILGVQVSSLMQRARLNADATRRVRQLQLLYEMTSAGAVMGQIKPVIERLLTQMLDAIPADLSAIHFLERTQFRLAGWKVRKGAVPEAPPTPEFMPVDDTSVIGRTAGTRKSTRVQRADFPILSQETAAREALEHLMAAPLLVGDRMVGTLSVGRSTDAAFTSEEAQLIESCAVHIAVILEHVRLYDDLKVSYDELAHTQAELVKHERLAALGELAAVMAHEVRNPLGVIFNSLTALKRLIRPVGDSELLLQIIGEEADRLNRIVGDLLDFARPYEALRKPISLEPIIGGAVDAAMAAVPNSLAKVVVEFPAELPPFWIDGHLIRQAFVNLIVNALQAMPAGGVVTVRALPEDRAGQLWARIEVRDEGGGIPAAATERIFQPFYTTKATGTGLGLAVVKRIVDAHHGHITVQARTEGGTTFTLRLPGGTVGSLIPREAEDDSDEDTQPAVAKVTIG